MKKKHIYLHVGTTKTGTTSIQAFLIQNREVLKSNDYIVYTPGKNTNPHDKKTTGMRQLVSCAGSCKNWLFPGKTPRLLEDLIQNLKHAEANNIVLSEENLWSAFGSAVPQKQQAFTDFVNLLQEFADVSVVVYLRRQDYYIMSAYQQSLKNGMMAGKTCRQWCFRKMNICVNRLAHYKARLKWLSSIVGKDNITVRVFEKEQFYQQSLIADFMNSIGLTLTEEYVIPAKIENPGLSPLTVEIIRCLSSFYRDCKVVLPFLRPENKGNEYCFNFNRNHKFLSPAERIDLLQRYKADNEWIAKEILDRHDGVLFYEPYPDINDSWEEYKLNAESVEAFFAKADFLDEEQKMNMKKQVLTALNWQKWISFKAHFKVICADVAFRLIIFVLRLHFWCINLITSGYR